MEIQLKKVNENKQLKKINQKNCSSKFPFEYLVQN